MGQEHKYIHSSPYVGAFLLLLLLLSFESADGTPSSFWGSNPTTTRRRTTTRIHSSFWRSSRNNGAFTRQQQQNNEIQHKKCGSTLQNAPESRRRRSWTTASSSTFAMTAMSLLRGGEIQYPANIVELEDIIEDAKTKNQLIVIDFYKSENCPPCERIAPLYKELSESEEFGRSGKILFLKVEVTEHPFIVNQFSVTGWPTIIFIKNGQVQTEVVGGKLVEATLYDWIKLSMPKDTEAVEEQQEEEEVKKEEEVEK